MISREWQRSGVGAEKNKVSLGSLYKVDTFSSALSMILRTGVRYTALVLHAD